MPLLPTLIEAGITGYDATNWGGILLSAGTPRADVGDRMISLGAEPVTITPEELGELVMRELARNGKIIQDAEVQAE